MSDSEPARMAPLSLPEGTERRALVPKPSVQVSSREPAGRTRRIGWLAAIALGLSLLIMVGATLVRQDWMYPPLRLPAGGFPFALTSVRVPKPVVVFALWISGLLAAGGLAAGLVAARRGARPPMRLVLVAAGLVVAVLAFLPPAPRTCWTTRPTDGCCSWTIIRTFPPPTCCGCPTRDSAGLCRGDGSTR
jgi:hypothetical protein